ncbi:MAG: alpha/beta hydrolase [Candidatus Acidiferrales bacterium]
MKTCVLGLIFLLAVTALPATAQNTSKPSPVATAGQQVVRELVTGEFDKIEAQYDSRMAAALPPGKLAAGWASLIQQTGDYQSTEATRVDRAGIQDVATVTCRFQRAVLDARIAFDADGKIAGINIRPHQEPAAPWNAPAYAKPDSFSEQPLTLANGKYELPGTLTMPKGDGPFAAVVLVQGSGPEDEDETIGGSKPFKDLAWGLASHGIAVFRYIKRTAKYGTQVSDDPARLTVNDETISDARAAVSLVAKQPKINPVRVFLLGHSLGAYLAPRIATGDTEIAGIIMLAANSQPMEQLVVEQIRYLASLNGPPNEQAQKEIQMAEDAAKQIESPDLKQGDNVPFLGTSSPASYWLDLRGYHPVSTAALLEIPILILQGGRDYQVPMSNFQYWKSELVKNKNVTLKLYPDLNHLFIAGTGPSTPQEYAKPGHVGPAVVADIAAWIAAAPAKSPERASS